METGSLAKGNSFVGTASGEIVPKLEIATRPRHHDVAHQPAGNEHIEGLVQDRGLLASNEAEDRAIEAAPQHSRGIGHCSRAGGESIESLRNGGAER